MKGFFYVSERPFSGGITKVNRSEVIESCKKLTLEPEMDILMLSFSMIFFWLLIRIQLIYQQVPIELQQTQN